jgi:hypothetical protein
MDRTHDYWSSAFTNDAPGEPALPPMVMADLLVTQALGCVELWVHGEVEDANLASELCRSAAAILLGVTHGPERDRLMALVAAPRSLRIASAKTGA